MTGHGVSSMQRPPRSAVFTTLRYSKERGLFLFDLHSVRFQEHAENCNLALLTVLVNKRSTTIIG